MSSMTHDHDYIPFEIQTEIIKRVQDVKSLLRFRSVSKPWKSVIDSPKFIAAYQSDSRCILASHKRNRKLFVSMVDDGGDSIPRRNPPTVALPLDKTFDLQFIGHSQGLFCFHAGSRYKQMGTYEKWSGLVVVWNPSIRKSVTIDDMPSSCINFGVCPRTKDPKFVIINCEFDFETFTYISNSAEIYTLSSGAWRSLCINLPDGIIISDVSWSYYQKDAWAHHWPYNDACHHRAAVDGTLYWHVYTTSRDRIRKRRYHRIITFDLASEEFGEVIASLRA